MAPVIPALALIALLQQPPPLPPAPVTVDTTAPDLVDCAGRCPDGVSAPRFVSFPQLYITDWDRAGVDLRARRSRTFLLIDGVVGADGIIETETLQATGGTARGMETEMRRALAQARFTAAKRGSVPIRSRVTFRFDFEAEGNTWLKYTYRVTAR